MLLIGVLRITNYIFLLFVGVKLLNKYNYGTLVQAAVKISIAFIEMHGEQNLHILYSFKKCIPKKNVVVGSVLFFLILIIIENNFYAFRSKPISVIFYCVLHIVFFDSKLKVMSFPCIAH